MERGLVVRPSYPVQLSSPLPFKNERSPTQPIPPPTPAAHSSAPCHPPGAARNAQRAERSPQGADGGPPHRPPEGALRLHAVRRRAAARGDRAVSRAAPPLPAARRAVRRPRPDRGRRHPEALGVGGRHHTGSKLAISHWPPSRSRVTRALVGVQVGGLVKINDTWGVVGSYDHTELLDEGLGTWNLGLRASF